MRPQTFCAEPNSGLLGGSDPRAKAELASTPGDELLTEFIQVNERMLDAELEKLALQQNLWVNSGSGRAPRVWYKAISAAW